VRPNCSGAIDVSNASDRRHLRGELHGHIPAINSRSWPAAYRRIKFIAAIFVWAVVEKILTHLGEDPWPPPKRWLHKAGHDYAA
jgi:hypothetical protein